MLLCIPSHHCTFKEQKGMIDFFLLSETTDRLFHEHKLAEFLKRYGVYGHGLWRRESPLLHKEQPNKKCGQYVPHRQMLA